MDGHGIAVSAYGDTCAHSRGASAPFIMVVNQQAGGIVSYIGTVIHGSEEICV